MASFANLNEWPELISDIEVRDYLNILICEDFMSVLKPEGKFN